MRRALQSPVVLAGIVAAAGVGARWALFSTVGEPPELHGDEVDYAHAARMLLGGEGYPGSARPPGWPFLLSVVWRIFEPSLTTGRMVQFLLGLLVALLISDWARRAWGPRAGLLSGLLCAVHPTLVDYGLFFWAEPLYTALLVLAFWSLFRFLETQRAGWVFLSGIAFGLAALTREFVLFFVPVVLLWLWRRLAGLPQGSAPWRPALLLAGGVLLAVLPWTARNTALHGRIVPISTIRWLPVALGNLLPDDRHLLSADSDEALVHRYLAMGDELQREEVARRVALDAIRKEQPGWLPRKVVRNTYLLFRTQGQLRKFLKSGWLAPEGREPAARWVVLETAFYVVTTSLAIVALWRVRADPLKGLVGAYVLFTWTLHILANANHRFRLPLLPFLALYSGPLLAREWGPSTRLRSLGLLACLLAFAGVLVADLLGAG